MTDAVLPEVVVPEGTLWEGTVSEVVATMDSAGKATEGTAPFGSTSASISGLCVCTALSVSCGMGSV